MKRKQIENKGFSCENCHKTVHPLTNGSYRNHCPFCLHSLHLDLNKPGDRLSECRGIMEPIDVIFNSNKGYQIIFKCKKCQYISRNRAALDDPIQNDSLNKLISIMQLKVHQVN